ncbi:MAG: very short patch repair endonuclease [Candidatus Dormibacteraeota bacterium]|nr:very short patch repair endonuclease [Candidatus Dormibacteraeota bacterium]
MRRNTKFDTRVELHLRSELHRRGLRFRVHVPIRIGESIVRPDIVFTRQRVAVFVDGCFWHGCPDHGTSPRHNPEYWTSKMQRNRARDAKVNRALSESGWRVLRIWEHLPIATAADQVTAVTCERTRRVGAQ